MCQTKAVGRRGWRTLGAGVAALLASTFAVQASAEVPPEAVSAGYFHTCAKTSDNSLWCWGFNGFGQLGDNTSVERRTRPVRSPFFPGTVAEIAAGGQHTCVRKTDNTLWCWGENSEGQVGDGTTVDRLVPKQITSLGTTVTEISAGFQHTCARKLDGTLWCWGKNSDGRLGDGTTTRRTAPTQVLSLGSNVVEVSAGSGHTCASQSNNQLWCWGLNSHGQVGDGSTAHRLTPVGILSQVVDFTAGEGNHTGARTIDGTAYGWGDNARAQLGLNSAGGVFLTPTVAPSPPGRHSEGHTGPGLFVRSHYCR